MSGCTLHIDPHPEAWNARLQAFDGELFGRLLADLRNEFKEALGLPLDKKIIVVGHQPMLFHPGIAAKFIAATQFAEQVGGLVVHLVVDHFDGDVGLVEVPSFNNGIATIRNKLIAQTVVGTPLIEQPRAEVTSDCEMGKYLRDAEGQHAAAQFAHAMQLCIAPFAHVDYTLYSSELLQTAFGKTFIDAMRERESDCRDAYNRAAFNYPEAEIAMLGSREFPIWDTPNGMYPKALLLTALARIGFADLFVHGLGGARYDVVMEEWMSNWLGIELTNTVTVSADLRLDLDVLSIEHARKAYAVPSAIEQDIVHMVHSIEVAEPYSEQRKQRFDSLQSMRDEHGERPDVQLLKQSLKVANKRDWPLFCYSEEQLKQLAVDVEQNLNECPESAQFTST